MGVWTAEAVHDEPRTLRWGGGGKGEEQGGVGAEEERGEQACGAELVEEVDSGVERSDLETSGRRRRAPRSTGHTPWHTT